MKPPKYTSIYSVLVQLLLDSEGLATVITVEGLVLRHVAKVGAGLVTQYADEREARSQKGDNYDQL